jgi:hypothetical protein
MTGPTLIALFGTFASLGGAFVVAWPSIIEQRSRAKTRRDARKYVAELWDRGDEESAVKLLAWIHEPDHNPPQLSPSDP